MSDPQPDFTALILWSSSFYIGQGRRCGARRIQFPWAGQVLSVGCCMQCRACRLSCPAWFGASIAAAKPGRQCCADCEARQLASFITRSVALPGVFAATWLHTAVRWVQMQCMAAALWLEALREVWGPGLAPFSVAIAARVLALRAMALVARVVRLAGGASRAERTGAASKL